MSKDDMHYGMRSAALTDGWSPNADVNNEQFTTYQQLKMVLSPPQHRAQALEIVDNAIADNSTTLRSRAQLLNLRRRLSATHEAMLKARR